MAVCDVIYLKISCIVLSLFIFSFFLKFKQRFCQTQNFIYFVLDIIKVGQIVQSVHLSLKDVHLHGLYDQQ